MENWKNKKVVIMGLGLHGGGVGAAEFFARQGAKVLVTDLKNRKQLEGSIKRLNPFSIKYVLGTHRFQDFTSADLIIKNPGVVWSSPYLKLARKSGVPIETDVGFFLKHFPGYVIGVTGTKGKSTTASLIYEFLKRKFKSVKIAGNIGISPLEILGTVKKKYPVVLELSSFELENLKQSPPMAVFTNIYEDHLDRYGSMDNYTKAKEQIFRNQKRKDILILNFDDPYCRNFAAKAPSRVYLFSASSSGEMSGAYLKEGKIFFAQERRPIISTQEILLAGDHNLANVLAAVSAARLMGITASVIRKTLRIFKGIHSRQELIAKVKGVSFFNDTAATMPHAARAALKTMREKFPHSKLILIAGGQSKKTDYSQFIKDINSNVSILVLLPGTASEVIEREISPHVYMIKVSSMKEAVAKSAERAGKGDIVLLSPGAASFNLFQNEFDRGRQFNEAVESLKRK